MERARIKSALIIASLMIAPSWNARTDDRDYYPNARLHDVDTIKKAQLEKEKRRVEAEIETANTDLARVTDQLGAYRDEHKKLDDNNKTTQEYLIQVQQNLKATLQQLNDEVASLTGARKKSEQEIERRGLAATQQTSEMLGGARIWITKEKCKAYSHPKNSANAVGFFDAHNRLLGKDSGSSWVEISNGADSSVYVPSKCGKYESEL